jgi:DNA-binding MarR family transcriptional regulator
MSESKPQISVLDSASDAPALDAAQIADRLHSAAIHLLRRLRIRDLESGIGPAQLSALSVLVFGGPRSLGELAAAEQVRAPTMSRIVSGLERTGLVRRKPTNDKRRVRLEPTAKGTKILQEGRRRRVESLAKALQGLSNVELQQTAELAAFMQQLVRKL